MSKVSEVLENIKSQIISLATKLEESSQFEKVTLQFEALDPRYQKRIKAGLLIFFILSFTIVLFLPVIGVLLKKNENSAYHNIIGDMQGFNSSVNVTHLPAPRPQGWTALPSGSIDEIEASLNQFLALNGVPLDFTKVQKSGQNISIVLEQVSILQSVNFLFQLDGWYPALQFSSLNIKVNPENPQLLNFTAELSFNAAEGGKLNQTLGNPANGIPNSDGSTNSATAPNSDPGNVDPSAPPPSNDYDFAAPPPPSNDDFGAELPPPPPFDEDI